MSTSTQVRLARRPEGEPDDDTFSFEDHELPELEDGQLLLRVVYLSLDPYMRGRMSDAPSYADPVEVGDVHGRWHRLRGRGVPPPVVRRGRHGAVLLRLADPRDQRRQRPAPARPVGRARLDRARRARDARASRRTPDCSRSAGRSRARPSSSPRPPARSARPSARSRRSRAPARSGIAGGEAKRQALLDEFGFDVALDHRSPTFADDLAAAVPGRHRRLLRERQRPGRAARCSSG